MNPVPHKTIWKETPSDRLRWSLDRVQSTEDFIREARRREAQERRARLWSMGLVLVVAVLVIVGVVVFARSEYGKRVFAQMDGGSR